MGNEQILIGQVCYPNVVTEPVGVQYNQPEVVYTPITEVPLTLEKEMLRRRRAKIKEKGLDK